MLKHIISKSHEENGWVLPLVLMLVLVFTLLGTAAYTATQSSLKQAQKLIPAKQAEYLARSAVDATKDAWTVKWLDDPSSAPATAHFYTRYDKSTDEFVNVSPDEKDNHDGVIETTLSFNNIQGICSVQSTAKVDNISKTVKAVSEKLLETENTNISPPWYIKKEKSFLWWGWNEYYVKGNPDQVVTDPDTNLSTSYHYEDCIVNVNLPEDEPLYLRREVDPRVGYQAKRIMFNCDLDLYSKNFSFNLLNAVQNPCFLIVSAETIQFNRDLIINDSANGALILHLPEGAGISGEVVYQNLASAADKSKVDLDAYYGLVQFSNVNIYGSFVDYSGEKLIENKTFFYRHADGSDSLPIGIEPEPVSFIADWLGLTDPNTDFRCPTLISKGYLIEAGSDIKNDYQVLFIYE